jgi:hypothetical protein
MQAKTKIFSLAILAVLIVPIFLNPPKNGNVLGVSEVRQNSNTQTVSDNLSNTQSIIGSGFSFGNLFNTNTPTQGEVVSETTPQDTASDVQYKLKDISSGIRDTKKRTDQLLKKELRGKIVWDANISSPVSSDKYPLGTGITVSHNNKSTNLVVSNVAILAPDTLLKVDQKTFTQLGGDLEKEQDLQVTITVE